MDSGDAEFLGIDATLSRLCVAVVAAAAAAAAAAVKAAFAAWSCCCCCCLLLILLLLWLLMSSGFSIMGGMPGGLCVGIFPSVGSCCPALTLCSCSSHSANELGSSKL